jgi:hypothetical protein
MSTKTDSTATPVKNGASGGGKKLNSILNRTLSDSVLNKKSFSAPYNNSFYVNQRRDYALTRKNRYDSNILLIFFFNDSTN